MKNELIIDRVSTVYPDGTVALKEIDLTIGNGMFGLLGANGSGKSSLMRSIATLQLPSSGRILFNGVNLAVQPDAIRTVLGYLPQEFGVYPRVSASRLLDYFAVLKGVGNRRVRREQVDYLLHRTNLYTHRNRSVHRFSGGMKQRFGIAQALLGTPKIVIVDEPTAGLDPEERHRFLNLLSELGEDLIILLSTHLIADVGELCSRMAILDAGRIVTTGKPREMVDRLSGKVFRKIIAKEELNRYRDRHRLLSSRLAGGRLSVRVLAERAPDPDFRAVTAGLEDVYFASLSTGQKTVIQ